MRDFMNIIIWKELKFLSERQTKYLIGTIFLLYSITSPILSEVNWFSSGNLISIVVTFTMLANLLTNRSINSEKRDHSLASLLSTNINGHAIIYGKIAVHTVFVYLMLLASIASSSTLVNLFSDDTGMLFFDTAFFTETCILTPFFILFFCCISAFLSILFKDSNVASFLINIPFILFMLIQLLMEIPNSFMDKIIIPFENLEELVTTDFPIIFLTIIFLISFMIYFLDKRISREWLFSRI